MSLVIKTHATIIKVEQNVLDLKSDYEKFEHRNKEVEEQLKDIKVKLKKLDISKKGPIKVHVTGYTTARDECGPHTPYGASGVKVRPGMAAVSHDLKKHIKYGTKIHLKGFGVFIVQDLMNKRWRNKVDLVMTSKREALKFGVQKTELRVLD